MSHSRANGNETAEVIARIIRESGRCPRNLQIDMGKEFYNADVQRLVKKHGQSLFDVFGVKGIGHHAIQSHAEGQHVEDVYTPRKLQVDRRAAASRVRLQRAQASNDRHATHRRHACGRRKTLDYDVQLCKDRRAKFKVGDSVRVSKYKTIFEKGYTSNWTTEVFKIVKVQCTSPVTYLLEDYRGKSVVGAFYEHELLRAADPDVYLVDKILRRRGDKVYVKWLGFGNSHNSWIHKDNVI